MLDTVQLEMLRVIQELQREMKELKKVGRSRGVLNRYTVETRKGSSRFAKQEEVLLDPRGMRA